MSTFVFTAQRVRELRQRPGQVNAVLTTRGDSARPGRIRHFYREFATHDADGRETGNKRERVNDRAPSGDLRPARLTVLLIELVDVYGTEAWGEYRVLDYETAQSCGFKTLQEMREDWKHRHPQSDLAKLAWFALGDVRDRDRFLRRYIWRGGDYAGQRADDVIDGLPVLTEEQMREVAANNHQRQIKREADGARNLAEESLAQRLARLENAGDQMIREIKNELNIIAERAERGRRKLDRL